MNQETKNKIKHYTLAGLGFFILFNLLYFRFIRDHLPSDIPFNLSELSFYIIVMVCLFYGLTIIHVWFPPKKPSIIYKMVYPFLDFIGNPFIALGEVFKNNKDVFSHILRIIKRFLKFYTTVLDERQRVYIMIYIFPRFFLLFMFALDIFYFKQLHYIYVFFFIPFFFFIYRYVYFSVKKTLDQTKALDEKYLTLFVENYEIIEDYKIILKTNKRVKKLLTLINLGYLICWVYILSVSFNMELLSMELLKNILNTFLSIRDQMDPFSGMFL